MTDFSQTSSTESADLPPQLPAPARVRLVDILQADVTPQVEATARQLIASGDALLVKNSRNAVHGFVLDQDHYDTRLEWTPAELHAVCACQTRAAGFVCPHLWATVLLADRSGAFRSLEEAKTHPIFLRAGVPGVAPEARRSPNAWPVRAGWKIHLASISQASARTVADAGAFTAGLPRQVIYTVDAAETRAAAHGTVRANEGAIIIELQSRHQRKPRMNSPSWSKPAPFRLDPNDIETFTDAGDREILSRIVGARLEQAVVEDARTSLNGATGIKNCALRGAVGVDLLRRMCETGRCRLRLDPAVGGGR